MKICIDCGLEKDESQFNPNKSRWTGVVYYRKMCKLCYNKRQSAYKKEWLAKMDPIKKQRMNIRKAAQLLKLNPDIVLAHFDSHSGRCDICNKAETMKNGRLHIDHCHESGKFRGLLCGKCNTALGLFGDDPKLLTLAIKYLNN